MPGTDRGDGGRAAGDRPVAPAIRAAEVVSRCRALGATVAFFTDVLGFRIEAVWPADDPAAVVVAGHGVRLRLERAREDGGGRLLLHCDDPALVTRGSRALCAPNGMRIEVVEADPALSVPAVTPRAAIHRRSDTGGWRAGRAGMDYLDLIPGRLGGAVVASRIRIRDAGPVPDYVHFHRVVLQWIFCRRGWVRVAYEGQGPPLTMRAGDCVLQPPGIRHRVLECSPALEVIELASPAAHRTIADHDVELPAAGRQPDRRFGGQRFVHHVAAGARWQEWRAAGFEARPFGFAPATGGLGEVEVVRPAGGADARLLEPRALLCLVLSGTVGFAIDDGEPAGLAAGDCAVIPAGARRTLAGCSPDLELLDATLPVCANQRA